MNGIEIGIIIKSFALPNGKTGIIVKKYDDRKGANGEDLYDVLDENGEIHTMATSLFDSIVTNLTDDNKQNQEQAIQDDDKEVNIEMIKIEIEQAIDNIISELGIEKSDNVMEQLRSCCLVQKYIVEHNNYDSSIMNKKEKYKTEEIATLDLYDAVVLKNGVCTSNSLMLKKILQRIGINAEVVGLISNESQGMHASNLVELDGKYYFFDSTLEREIYMENRNKTNGQLILCCAGLGKSEYCQYYTPKVLFPDNPTDNVLQLPDNIAESRIPQEIVNECIALQVENQMN